MNLKHLRHNVRKNSCCTDAGACDRMYGMRGEQKGYFPKE